MFASTHLVRVLIRSVNKISLLIFNVNSDIQTLYIFYNVGSAFS